jgi:hypothetical protein
VWRINIGVSHIKAALNIMQILNRENQKGLKRKSSFSHFRENFRKKIIFILRKLDEIAEIFAKVFAKMQTLLFLPHILPV